MTTKKKGTGRVTPKTPKAPKSEALPHVTSIDEVPAKGPFTVPFTLNFETLTPFEMMVMAEVCGMDFQLIGQAFEDAGDAIMTIKGVDVSKLMFSFARIGLGRIDESLDSPKYHRRAKALAEDPT